MIGQFTGSKTAQFPFILASKDDQQIYDPDCVPEGFVLEDLEHVRTGPIISLYRHLIRRQDEGLKPFIILNCGPKHSKAETKSVKGKGKAKAKYVDVTTNEESDESEDEDKEEKDEDEEEKDKEIREGSESDKSEDKVTSPPKKIGPPKRKFQQLSDDDQPAAGSSTLPPVKHASKKDLQVKKTKEGKTGKTKKRKPEEDLDGSPEKVSKLDGAKKSGRKEGKSSKPGGQVEIGKSLNEKPGKRKRDEEAVESSVAPKKLKSS